MESIFKNFNIFCREKSILKKNFENWKYFTKISEFFEKYFKMSHFQFISSHATNPEKFPMNSIINFRNLSKAA